MHLMQAPQKHRIAYVGLSSPIFYDYKSGGERLPNELSSAPNPILDGPFGLFLLFDEVWFLSRPLCPRNLRDAPFVRFLDETELLPQDLKSIDEKLRENSTVLEQQCFSEHQKAKFEQWNNSYRPTVRSVGVTWDAAPDNHTHSLAIGNLTVYANSASLDRVIFDMAIVSALRPLKVELITNTFTEKLFAHDEQALEHQALAQSLIIKDITSFVRFDGPYHPCIDEVRAIPELVDFRRWIASQPTRENASSLEQRANEIRRRINEEKDRVFLKWLSERSQTTNFARTIVGIAADSVVSFAGGLMELSAQLKELQEIKRQRWQAFVLQSDRILRPGD